MLKRVVHNGFFNLPYYTNLINFIYLVLIASQPFGNVCLWNKIVQWLLYGIVNFVSLYWDPQIAPKFALFYSSYFYPNHHILVVDVDAAVLSLNNWFYHREVG